MEQKLENIETITVDGVAHQVAELAPEIQKLTVIYSEWQVDAEASKKEHLKCAAALRDLSREIGQAVRAATEAEAAENVETESPVEDVVEDVAETVGVEVAADGTEPVEVAAND